MELRDLETFVAVAEELHFARAAQRLHVVPAVVTQRVKALEASLGVPLFRRTSRRVALTPEGLRLLGGARAVLRRTAEVTDLARMLAGETATRLAIAVGPNLGPFLPPLLGLLVAEVPDLRPTASSSWSEEAAAAVRSGAVDAAILRGPVQEEGLDEVRLGRSVDSHVAVAPDDPLVGTGPVPASAFEDRPFFLPDRAAAMSMHDRTVAWFDARGVRPRWRHHRLQSYELLLPFVAATRSATLVHEHAVATAGAAVRVLPLREPGPAADVVLVTRAADRTPVVELLRAAGRT